MAISPVEALQPALILLSAGTAAAFAARSLKISPIVGYLLAGIVIGPHGFGLMRDDATTHLLAELGVVFLLFDIGLHFSFAEMRQSRSYLLRLAPIQVFLTGFGFTLLLMPTGLDWPIALVLGMSLGLSSTAVVSRVLADRGLQSCPLGHSSMAVLIFQDIVAIFLLIFAGSLNGEPSALPVVLGLALLKALVAFAAAAAAGRFLVRPLFRVLAATRNQEAFTAVALLMVLASAWATGLAGLSLTLGGFLAGLAISDTRYRHQVMMEVQPFRGLLLSMFFINVGLMIDVPGLISGLPWVIAATVILLLGKTALGFLAAKLSGWTTPGATQLAFLIGQGSEFTLVIAAIIPVMAGVESQIVAILVAAVAISLAVAPSWTALGIRLAKHFARISTRNTADLLRSSAPVQGSPPPVLVYGITVPVRLTIDALRHFNLPYIALESDPDRFVAALADGYDVKFGDAADLRLVELVGASRARALVVGVPRFEVSRDLTPEVSERFPGMVRLVALEDPADGPRFSKLGIRGHFSAGEPNGIEMATDLLNHLEIPPGSIARWVEEQMERYAPATGETAEPVAA